MKDVLIQNIYEILERYTWEHNDERTRSKICYELSQILNNEVFDAIDNEVIDRGEFLLMVRINEKYSVSLINYLENYNIYQRNKKLKKILKN